MVLNGGNFLKLDEKKKRVKLVFAANCMLFNYYFR